jgi:hypothetical protein
MTIEAILDQCLEEIRQGRCSLADCLGRYPEHAKELEPLLKAALALEQMPDLRPSNEFKRGLRERILNFDKPEETEPIRDLLSSSDARMDPEKKQSHTSVSPVPAKKQGS